MEGKLETQEWYVLKDSKEHEGPLSLRDIDALYKTQGVRSNSLVWKEGMEEWKPLYQIDSLKELIVDSIAESEKIPDIKEAEPNSKDKTEAQAQEDAPNQAEPGAEPQMKKKVSEAEVEKLAGTAIAQLEGKDLMNIPDEKLTEEEKEMKYKMIRKEKKKRYRKNKAKKKWYKAKINTNIYISGLPNDVTAEELDDHFSKCGAIRLDPSTAGKKIKIYTDEEGVPKGDALISFENIESVDTAIEMLHQSNLRPDSKIIVERAVFEQKGEEYKERKRQKIDEVEKKRIKAEKERRFAWNEEQAASVGLKIVVLKHMFVPDEVKDNPKLQSEIEIDVQTEIEATCGKVEKMELFPDHPDGVIKIKFENTLSADKCVESFNGRVFDGREISAQFWDGKTNYKKVSESKEDVDQRVNEFGDWLQNQELPDELKQKKEAEGNQNKGNEQNGGAEEKNGQEEKV